MASARLVTLTTDIGDVYAAQMKAVLYRRLPAGHVVDLALDLPPHGIEEAAFLFRHLAERFPPGTVHVAVIDPGVGTTRRAIVIRCADGSLLVGPDNGVLSLLAARLGKPECREIRLGAASRADSGRSPTFDGREVFAPAAAALATGTPFHRVGPRVPFHSVRLPPPGRSDGRIHGIIIHIDRFGNLISTIPSDWVPLDPRTRWDVTVGRRAVRGIPRTRTYGDLPPRAMGVVGSSFGTLEVSAREAPAQRRFRARVGDALLLRPTTPPSRATRRGRRGESPSGHPRESRNEVRGRKDGK